MVSVQRRTKCSWWRKFCQPTCFNARCSTSIAGAQKHCNSSSISMCKSMHACMQLIERSLWNWCIAGMWNERPSGPTSYTVALRKSLDSAGFRSTKIILPDGHISDTLIHQLLTNRQCVFGRGFRASSGRTRSWGAPSWPLQDAPAHVPAPAVGCVLVNGAAVQPTQAPVISACGGSYGPC